MVGLMPLLKILRLKGLPWWSSGKDCAPNAGVPGSIPDQKARSYTPQLTPDRVK